MEVINKLTAVLGGGSCPAEFNEKKILKLTAKANKLQTPKAVKLYTIRDEFYAGLGFYYRVFACPLKEQEIDEHTLAAIKEDIGTLELGHLRYNAMGGETLCLGVKDEHGRFSTKDNDLDAVQTISNRYDGIVVFTFSDDKMGNLDCSTAFTGYDSKYGSLSVILIKRKDVGLESTVEEDFKDVNATGDPEEDRNIPAGFRMYNKLMRYLLYVMIAVAIIYWLFFK